MNQDNNHLWGSLDELACALRTTYSVSDPVAMREQYLNQVRQYPLYVAWFDKIISHIEQSPKKLDVLEYGSGPGILAKRIVNHFNVNSYTAIEPERTFREMTSHETMGKAQVLEGTARVRYNENLTEEANASKGEFIYIPADIPHAPENIGTDNLEYVVSRSSGEEDSY